MVVEGEDVVDVSRHIIGKTNPSGSYARFYKRRFRFNSRKKRIHGSDSVESTQERLMYGSKKRN